MTEHSDFAIFAGKVLEIVDEAGNIHGPFETKEEALKAVVDRGLGDERDADDQTGLGWTWQSPGIITPA